MPSKTHPPMALAPMARITTVQEAFMRMLVAAFMRAPWCNARATDSNHATQHDRARTVAARERGCGHQTGIAGSAEEMSYLPDCATVVQRYQRARIVSPVGPTWKLSAEGLSRGGPARSS